MVVCACVCVCLFKSWSKFPIQNLWNNWSRYLQVRIPFTLHNWTHRHKHNLHFKKQKANFNITYSFSVSTTSQTCSLKFHTFSRTNISHQHFINCTIAITREHPLGHIPLQNLIYQQTATTSILPIPQISWEYTHIDWVVVLRPTRHKIGHFGDVPQANRLVWHRKAKPITRKAHSHQSKETYDTK